MTDELNRTDQIPDGPGEVPAEAAGCAETGRPFGDQLAAVEPATAPAFESVADAPPGTAAEPASAEIPHESSAVAESDQSPRDSSLGNQERPGAGPSEAPEAATTAQTAADHTPFGENQPIVAEQTVAEQSSAAIEAGQPIAAPAKAKASASSRRKAPEPEPTEPKPKSSKMDWYILKVQSNREESIKEGLLRRVAIAGLDYYFGDVIVPTEKVTEFKSGKKRVRKRKLYPGYLVVQMEINDDTWFLVRETPGIGDFTGAAGRPAPMLPHEVSRILAKQEEKSEKAPKLNINFRPGDQVKINEGTFENFEGQVQSIDEQNGRVTVMINIFGRSTPVELEYWQIGSV